MELESKYNPNQQVWHVCSCPKEIREECPSCRGVGHLVGADGSKNSCSTCYGRRFVSEWEQNVPQVFGPYTIGQIRIVYTEASHRKSEFSNYGSRNRSIKVEYMMYETGVGSGTIYDEESLYQTKEEATQACTKGVM